VAKAAAVALRAAQNAGQIFFDIFSRASFFYQKKSRLQKINPNIFVVYAIHRLAFVVSLSVWANAPSKPV